MSMAKTPLVGYLDSQDYSRMADQKAQTPEAREARARLTSMVDSGRVTLPYSWAHVAEMSPDRSTAPQAAMARLELMERLASTQTFRHPARIIALENSDEVRGGREHTIGTWLKDPDALRRAAYKGAEDLVALLASSTEKHRDTMYRLCEEGPRSGVPLPRPPGLTNALPNAVVLSLLRLALDADIDGIAALYQERLEQPSVVSAGAAALGLQSGVAEQFEDLRGKIQRLLLNGKARWSAFTRNKEFQQTLRSIPQDSFAPKLAQILSPGVVVADLDRLRGVLTATRVLNHLYQETAGQGRTPRQSDGGDVLHAFYAPYVDVFSCDSHFAGVMKRVSPGTRAVTGGPLKVAFALQELIEQREREG